MAYRKLCLLLLSSTLSASSFVVVLTQHPTKVHRRGNCRLRANICRPELVLSMRYFSRGFSTKRRSESIGVLALGSQQAFRATEARSVRGQGGLPTFTSSDAVSYLQNPDTGSEMWLVGVVHGKTTSVELLESVIREIKPQVVMLELDAGRLDDLPSGSSMKGAMASATAQGGGDSEQLDTRESMKTPLSFVPTSVAKLLKGAVDALNYFFEGDISEMGIAVREAQACNARVLLGDRDFEETKHRLVAAGLADDVDDERLDDPEALLFNSLSRSDKKIFASLRLRNPETRETAREYCVALTSMCNTRALSAMIPERDEVMARNIMALEGNQMMVALVGIFHVDGIENILMDNGWQFG